MNNNFHVHKVGIIFHRYGPYHICRINALSKYFETIGFELSGTTKEYLWDKIEGGENFKRVTIFENEDSRDKNSAELKEKIFTALNKNPVDALLINGWGDKGGLIALKWCLKNKIPAIVMTEEIEATTKRTLMKEYLKKKIVALFNAALVGGTPQQHYVSKLGIKNEMIETGYDVVDNDYFNKQTKKTELQEEFLRQKYNLPQKYFLTSGRFIEKKNLFRLLEAYKIYLSSPEKEKWNLVMAGDGILKEMLQTKIAELNIKDKVLMPGFIQYKELPLYYAFAKAFIHPSISDQWGLVVNEAMASSLPVIVSNTCGCAEDLVKENVNGFLFNPFKADELSKKMILMSELKENKLKRMKEKSLQIISNYDPVIFGKSVHILIQKIQTEGNRKKGFLNILLLNLTIRFIQ